MSDSSFVHLQCQSEFSVENSLVRIPALVSQAKELGYSALALTDRFNMFAAVKFYQKATAAGIKPIFGAQVRIKNEEESSYALLLCQDQQGYLNLSELISQAYTGQHGIEGISVGIEQIKALNEGLIMVSSATTSDVAQHLMSSQVLEAKTCAQQWLEIFTDRYYLGVQRTARDQDDEHLHASVKLALDLSIPVVATNDVQFLTQEDFDAHEARICIFDGTLIDDTNRVKKHSPEQYLKSPEQMADLFADLPEALVNSVELAKRCNVHFKLFDKNYLPDFPVPEGMNMAQFFAQESEQGLAEKLQGKQVDVPTYEARLKFELDVIIQMDFPGYFLIVADFIRWSKENGIPVGPGRGSGAGSLVAYEQYNFHNVVQLVLNFCTNDLGGFYLDIIKDRQYTTQEDSRARRSAQSALYHLTEAMVRWLSPVLSYTAEEIWQNMPGEKDQSVFLSEWYEGLSAGYENASIETAREITPFIRKEMEQMRSDKVIGSSLDAEVDIYCSDEVYQQLEALGDELRFVFITSYARIHPLSAKTDDAVEVSDSVSIKVGKSEHEKCVRCWHHREDIGESSEHPELCGRCVENVAGDGEQREYA